MSGSSSAAFRLGAALLFSAEVSVREIGRGLAMGIGSATAGGVVVYFANRKKSARVESTSQQTIEDEHQHFLAAAEGSMDAFYILDSVRDQNGRIRDFSFRYLNPHAESRFKCSRRDALGTSYRKRMESILEDHQFRRYCEVVETGVPLSIEFPVRRPGAKITWLRHQVVKLGDGIAVTSTRPERVQIRAGSLSKDRRVQRHDLRQRSVQHHRDGRRGYSHGDESGG